MKAKREGGRNRIRKGKRRKRTERREVQIKGR